MVQYPAELHSHPLDISALSFKSVLVLGSNVGDDAAAHCNMAWHSLLENNMNSDLMFMNPKDVILLIYTSPATVMFSATLPMEALLDLLMLLGWSKLPDDDPA